MSGATLMADMTDQAPTGFSTFLPTIINDLGTWSIAQVQLLTVPCYFVGAAVYMMTALASDRLQMRGVFCLIFGTVSIIGYAVLMSDVAPAVHYFACFLVAGGLYVVVGLPLAWVSLGSICHASLASLSIIPMSLLDGWSEAREDGMR